LGLIDRARGLPPEFSADSLLTLAASPWITAGERRPGIETMLELDAPKGLAMFQRGFWITWRAVRIL
jgi:hypothetical protein